MEHCPYLLEVVQKLGQWSHRRKRKISHCQHFSHHILCRIPSVYSLPAYNTAQLINRNAQEKNAIFKRYVITNLTFGVHDSTRLELTQDTNSPKMDVFLFFLKIFFEFYPQFGRLGVCQ